jgi:hypothetical protein
MVLGMAWDGENLGCPTLRAAQGELVSVFKHSVHPVQDTGARPIDWDRVEGVPARTAWGLRLQTLKAADMILMMVGDPDCLEPEALIMKVCEHGGRVARIDNDHAPTRLPESPDDIV